MEQGKLALRRVLLDARQQEIQLAYNPESLRNPKASRFEMKQPCDEALIRAGSAGVPCAEKSRTWVLAATILGSSMAFIDSTVVNVALPALQSTFTPLSWMCNGSLNPMDYFFLP